MKKTEIIMGMPVTIEIPEAFFEKNFFEEVFNYFRKIDEQFSTYKYNSEISKINRGEITRDKWSKDMKTIFRLCENLRAETYGYFNILTPSSIYDPSGLVKGWAIHKASQILIERGVESFYLNVGGDIQTHGKNSDNKSWRIGIQNPFTTKLESIKNLYTKEEGVATSGTYVRGTHIYNPLNGNKPVTEIVSLTVIGPNIYEADRLATPAFAMGREGIKFIEHLNGFEGYMVDRNGIATETTGLKNYTTEK